MAERGHQSSVLLAYTIPAPRGSDDMPEAT